jgi:hypothetical protein
VSLKDGKYIWTRHATAKLRRYGLSASRVIRVIRHPLRIEEGILKGAVAAMQPAGGRRYSEIWAMYIPVKSKGRSLKLKVITAWRYPGRAPERDPVPQEILEEIKNIL